MLSSLKLTNIAATRLSFVNANSNTNIHSRVIPSFLSMMSKGSKQKQNIFAPLYKAKSENQQKYMDYLKNENVSLILSVGPAGTGKTMFACLEAIHMLKNDKINKIIITRPIIGVGDEELGFLPGSMMKKMEPWTQPIFDVFLQYFTKAEIDNFLYNGNIEISPLAFMRGRTFRNAFVIADEMQNSSPSQMAMFVTRFGENSKGVITGDLNQSDKNGQGQMNGLYNLLQKIERYSNREELERMVKIIRFDEKDVERSKLVGLMVNLYGNNNVIEDRNTNLNNLNNLFKYHVTRNNNDSALIPKHHMKCNGDCSL